MRPRSRTDLIVIHASATTPKMDIGVEEIRRWHLMRGFEDIGYHLVIRRDGRLERGRPLDMVGAHARGFNRNSVGVCLVGGLGANRQPEANFTKAQWNTLRYVVDDLLRLYPGSRVVGHRDLGAPKACPCFDVSAWLRGEIP